MAFSPDVDAMVIALGGTRGEVEIRGYSGENLSLVRTLEATGLRRIKRVIFSSNGKNLMAVDTSGTLAFWYLPSNRLLGIERTKAISALK